MFHIASALHSLLTGLTLYKEGVATVSATDADCSAHTLFAPPHSLSLISQNHLHAVNTHIVLLPEAVAWSCREGTSSQRSTLLINLKVTDQIKP